MYRRFCKPLLDFLLALLALALFGWLLLILALLVAVKLGHPVLFRQQRPGRGGRIFTLYKFRSMTDARDTDGKLLPDEARLTPFGQKLRSTSLDELPELLNILRGDMSFIGPRPLLVQYLPRYNDKQARRHELRPGLTGWAQVNGRNAIDWSQKFEYDVWYVDHVSAVLDLRIFARTVLSVLRREGISAAGEATMGEFMGNEAGEADGADGGEGGEGTP
ncbi:MAG: sugar transferase [Clostridiales Family XIII bacterium]|jgi:lipopolysaccharide/colanic/teichoic acid biosynthesis glycosyltransferase|nr:sugar transferase [Clostridiales Family XIII bacterium]